MSSFKKMAVAVTVIVLLLLQAGFSLAQPWMWKTIGQRNKS